MQFDSFSDADAAAVFDFLSDYWDDVEAGCVRSLREYLERFPEAQEAVAAEYLKLQEQVRAKAGPREAEASRREDASALPLGDPVAGSESEGGGDGRVGPYRILRELGRGGQGRVVLAEDSRIERRVALKILDGVFVTEERRQRFRREAEVIARLSHPGICSIHEADIEGAVPYIAMQFIEGETLAAALDRARRNAAGKDQEKSVFVQLPWIPRTRTEVARVLAFFERAARALHAAHEAGVIHRDIKPANIAIDSEGQPVLLDFGLARDEESAAPGLTRTGDIFGTPAYMSPEQLRGARHGMESATDVYSLGASLYEALIGSRPFAGEGRVALERAVLEAPLPDVRGLNSALGEDVRVVLETALERDVRRRYSSSLELAEDLRRIREYEPIRARSAGPVLRLQRWARRQPALAAVLVTSFVLLTGALIHARVLLSREQRANRFALGRHLAERSTQLLSEEPAEALLVATRAVELAPGYLTRSALFAPLEACFLKRVLEPAGPIGRAWDLELSPAEAGLAVAYGNGEVHWWQDALTSPPRVLSDPAHTTPVRSIAIDSSGTRLAAAFESGHFALFETTREPRLLATQELEGPLLWVDFAPDGEQLVVQPARAPAAVFSVPDLSPICKLSTEVLSSGCAQFSPDGSRILTAPRAWQGLPLTESRCAVLWDATTGTPLARLRGEADVQWAEMDRAGDRVAVAFGDGAVRLFDVETGSPTGAALEHEGQVLCATFSPDGRQLVTTSDSQNDSSAILWELERGAAHILDGHDGNPIVHAAFASDGRRLATASFDRAVRIFDATTGELSRTLRARFRPLRVHWSHDGETLYTLSNSVQTHIWSVGNLPFTYRLEPPGLASTPNEALCWAEFLGEGRALTASRDGHLRLWSTPRNQVNPRAARASDAARPTALDGQRAPGELMDCFAGEAPLVGAEAHPIEDVVLAWDESGTVALWDLADSRAPRASFAIESAVSRACFDADGKRVVAVGDCGKAWTWDPASGVTQLLGAAVHAAFGPRGELLATASAVNCVRVFDARFGEPLRDLGFDSASPAGAGARYVAFHPVRSEVAVACGDGRVRYFNPRSGRELGATPPLFQLSYLEYSPDGKKLLVLGDAGGASVRVLAVDGSFDGPGGAGVQAQLSHKSRIRRASFDASGSLVLTVSVDGTAFVFSAADGRVYAHHTLHEGPLQWGAFAPAAPGENPLAGRIITASSDGTAAVWPIDPYPAALARKPRELHPWEWSRELQLSRPPE